MSVANTIKRNFGDKSKTEIVPGFFRGMDGKRAKVDFGGGRVPADMAMDVLPQMNDPVLIMLVDGGSPLVIGFTIPRPSRGTVVSVVGNVAVVRTSLLGDVEADMLALINVGDEVLLHWNDGPTVLGASVSARTPGTDPGAPGGGPQEQSKDFSAVQSGSWRGGRWWTPQVRAGDTNQGAWTYGTKIRDTIPANAAIRSVQLFVSPVSVGGSAPNFALHSMPSLAGPPGYGPTAAIGVPGGPDWISLPTSWGDLLKAGGGYLGVGVNHGGNNIFNSVGADGRSGMLRIRYVS